MWGWLKWECHANARVRFSVTPTGRGAEPPVTSLSVTCGQLLLLLLPQSSTFPRERGGVQVSMSFPMFVRTEPLLQVDPALDLPGQASIVWLGYGLGYACGSHCS
ncbi:hypothetical protein SKAU_G00247670 [Synaphobranchus kaupii]|uniref:Uncharacterized protein n=1 Tax=Synaphobranchus kaupii TaxID=118154 RepID=A0A9Q1F2N0_SYNKA|nr:hypothetical protein SKAU_G00247670 [Synaphobranchus kaupii]